MDDNKLNKLREIGYTIRKCCGNCLHNNLDTNWGTCGVQFYEHKKHEGGAKSSKRNLSIHETGYCEKWEQCTFSNLDTWHFKEFYERS